MLKATKEKRLGKTLTSHHYKCKIVYHVLYCIFAPYKSILVFTVLVSLTLHLSQWWIYMQGCGGYFLHKTIFKKKNIFSNFILLPSKK